MPATPDDYAECVLDLVNSIPYGRVSTYGVIAELARDLTGKGGPRTVGMVLSRYGSGVAWWRVCAAGGRLAAHKSAEQRARLRAEDVPFTHSGRVAMTLAGWPN
ncbi:MAG TPA: MGMT family protein [Beutenbergiaceae bacterium]|nr:MGMT family protein [Beutenbergiaceae bacterium]